MAVFKLNYSEIERFETALKQYEGNTEEVINDVLHNYGGNLIQEEIKRLMPMSNKHWKGKKPPAKTGNSLQIIGTNLAVTVSTKSAYHYLYFPDDGTNTRRHAGNQQFFMRGAENKKDEIVDRCINRLIEGLEDAIN